MRGEVDRVNGTRGEWRDGREEEDVNRDRIISFSCFGVFWVM